MVPRSRPQLPKLETLLAGSGGDGGPGDAPAVGAPPAVDVDGDLPSASFLTEYTVTRRGRRRRGLRGRGRERASGHKTHCERGRGHLRERARYVEPHRPLRCSLLASFSVADGQHHPLVNVELS